MTDLIKQLTGRARFCRDRGEEKTPGLLEEAAAQLAEAQAAQALVVERAEEAVDAEWRRKVGLNCTEVCAIIRALAPVDGLALVRELRAERDAADQRAGAMLARIVALEADGEAARSAASTNFARAVAAEADRDRLAAANAALEARLANGMKWCDLMDGPVSKSQFVNGQATAAQQIRAALAEVQADARREGGE